MKMLINATRAEQLRVAVVEGTTLHEYQVQIDESGLTRGNIYRGVVANIQPSLNAAFIDIGEERHGFLPVADVLESAYQQAPPKNKKRPSIDQVLKKGQPILVQVTKDGVGQKGAALTTNIALAGRYLVLTPFDGVRGISRKAEDDKDRKTIKGRLKKLDLPSGHGVIVRTNGIDQNQATLNRDMNALLRLWRKVQSESNRGKGPRLLYSDQDLVVQALRDYLDPDIEQVVVDSDEVHEKAEDYMKAFMPRSKTRLVRYRDALPLFSRYRLETQIDKIYERTAALPSGGSIVIDLTEALTAIDVNSGRATRNSNHEDSIFKINCEAAKEVARQLRLRDIGGLVVVDFIDMRLRKHQARLERTMRDAMKPDKARYSVGRISPNGLLEINRQRIKQSLRLRTHRPCPTCNGQATIPSPEFSALRLLSRIEGRAASGRIKHVTVALHPEMADMLQNHFRRELMGLEQDHDVEVEILASSTLRRTEERLDWVERSDEEAKARERARKKEPAFSSTDLTAESRRRSRKSRKKDDDESRQQSRQQSSKQQSKGSQQNGSDDLDDEPKKTSSRRRRSRRRKDDDLQSGRPQEAQSSDQQAKSDDDDGSKSTRRRRRRGGRGRQRRNGDAASSQDPQQSAKGGDEDESARSDSSSDEGKTSTRRRRSRSRSRGRGDDAPETSNESKRTAKESEEKSTDDEPKVVRRRRRSRRSDSGTDGEAQTSQDVKPSRSSRSSRPSQDENGASDSESGEARKRTRSRSSSRRSSSAKSTEPAEAAAEAKAKPDRTDESSQDGGGTTRRRRSRSRSRSRGGDTDSPRPAEASSAQDAAPESTPESTPERRTRSRSRSRSKDAGSKDAGSNGQGGAHAEAKDAQESKPPQAAEPAKESASPVGVLAGQGVEPKPKKRRWAWWGGPSDPAPDPNESN